MLEQKLHLLEEKISMLLDALKQQRQENKDLQEANRLLDLRAREEADLLTQENATLQQRIADLESEKDASNTKEQEIRDRLRVIIDKIDAIEQMSTQE
jgi:uncharacterized protein YlxW (UPF0749 family)